MHHVVVNNLSIAYQRAGDGPPLVLLHGFSLDSRTWRPQIEALSAQFSILAWDAPGAGQSQDPSATFVIGDWVEALAGTLDDAGIRQAHVLGLSWGGLLAQEFYRLHPSRVLSLILAGTYAGWTGSLSARVAAQRLEAALADASLPRDEFVKKYLPGMFGDAPSAAVQTELGGIMGDFHPHGFRLMATALAVADTRDLLQAVDVPAFLVWGSADKRSPVGVGQAMRDAIPGARLEVIDGAGHLINLERPLEFNAIVREFCTSAP